MMLDAFNAIHTSVLREYTRPVVHMRQQITMNRFGLMFGAGLSKGLGIPTWPELVKKIAADPEVKGQGVLKIAPPRAGLPYVTELLFEYFKRARYSKSDAKHHNTRPLDCRIAADWRSIIQKHLYKHISGSLSDLLKGHPYFKAYLPLVRRSHMTVTYNFDDFIEQSILATRPPNKLEPRGCESVTNPWTQFRGTTAIIYHPNGVVPQNPMEEPSDRFVFSEASFAEQMMGIFAGDQAGLVSHLSKHTCLLIGLSLDDDTLRSALTQSARACPGNYHYYIHYMNSSSPLDDKKKQAIKLANFKVYNLITLFLDDDGLLALGELINVDEFNAEVFRDQAAVKRIPVQFRFYVTGVMGVGKSTTINYFRNVNVLDEWLEQRIPLLAREFSSLTAKEEKTVDSWVANQFNGKNEVLRRKTEGIFLLDRGPIDPVAFTPEKAWAAKASCLIEAICPGHATWTVEDGRVILFHGDENELALRMVISHRKEYTTAKLLKMDADLKKAYGENGVTRFDVRGLSPSEVARRLAEIIHMEPYGPTCDLHKRLEAIKRDGPNVTA